jgi:hypothetical protein
VAAYAARAVYDADGNSAMSSVSEDIDVFGGNQGGRLVVGVGLGGWELTRAWANECEVLYEDLRSRAEENATYVLPPLCDCSLLTFISALCSLISPLYRVGLPACLLLSSLCRQPHDSTHTFAWTSAPFLTANELPTSQWESWSCLLAHGCLSLLRLEGFARG